MRRLPGVLFYGIRAFRPSLFGDQPRRRSAGKLLTRDEAWCIAANIGKLPQKHTGLYRTSAMTSTSDFRRTALTDVMGHNRKWPTLFDNLIGAGREHGWDFNTKRLCRL